MFRACRFLLLIAVIAANIIGCGSPKPPAHIEEKKPGPAEVPATFDVPTPQETRPTSTAATVVFQFTVQDIVDGVNAVPGGLRFKPKIVSDSKLHHFVADRLPVTMIVSATVAEKVSQVAFNIALADFVEQASPGGNLDQAMVASQTELLMRSVDSFATLVDPSLDASAIARAVRECMAEVDDTEEIRALNSTATIERTTTTPVECSVIVSPLR